MGNIFPKDPKRRKKIYTFSSFVLLSVLFWLIIKLSQDNEARFELGVDISNIPAGYILKDMSHDRIAVDLRTVGARLFYIQLSKQPNAANLDFSEFNMIERDGEIFFYVTSRDLEHSLPSFLYPDSEIVSIHPDTLFLEVNEAKKKEVPVVFNGSLDFYARHRQYGEIDIKPERIMISGPADIVETIDTLYTKEIHLKKLDKPVEKHVEVINPFPAESITLSDDNVKVFVDVREYTESKVEVPINIKCPEVYNEQVANIRLFPSRVTVFYLVALEDYGEITDDMFSVKAECPFEKANNNRLSVEVESKPLNIEILRFEPPRVEYILLR